MGLYRRSGSSFWWYKFKIEGRTHRGSTEVEALDRLKAAARAKEADERRKLLAPPDAKKNEVTLGDAAAGWLQDEGSALNDAKNNESRVRKLFGECAGPRGQDVGRRFGLSRGLKLQHLSNEDITRLARARKAEGNSPKTVNRELALLQSIIRYARVKLRAQVPLELDLAEYKASEGKGRLRFLALDEEKALLDDLNPQLRYTPEEWRAVPPVGKRQQQDQYDLAVFLLDTGGRYGEGSGVLRDVVDLERGLVNLYRDKVGNEGDLALTKRLRAVLARRLNDLPADQPYLFPGYGENADGPRGYAVKGIRKAMERVGINAAHKVARFGKATPAHTLRHTFASRLAQAGFPLQKIQVLMGHASIKTTEIYAHLIPSEAAREAADVLDRIHAPKARAKVVQLSPTNDEGGTDREEIERAA